MLRLLISTFIFTLTTAHIPYLDSTNSHNSYSSAFTFPDAVYSRALCTTTTCPPRFYQYNQTSYSHGYKPWSPQSWSKVHLSAGELLHFEFGVPHLPALEYPAFRPTVYLLGECLPSCTEFEPEPQSIEYPPLDLPYGSKLKALMFHLWDPIYEPVKFYEEHLDATFLSYLNYTVDVGCEGDVYIVVESYEKRITEYYVAVGATEGFPTGGDLSGIATLEEAKEWANGEGTEVGRYCKRRGFWEKE